MNVKEESKLIRIQKKKKIQKYKSRIYIYIYKQKNVWSNIRLELLVCVQGGCKASKR